MRVPAGPTDCPGVRGHVAARGKSAADPDVVDARFVEIVPDVRVVQQIEFVSEDPARRGWP